MTDIAGLAYYEVDFNADGTLNTDPGGGNGGLPNAVAAGGISDLFFFAHGWNNGVVSAQALYNAMFTLLAGQLGTNLATSAGVGVIWPALLFPDDDPSNTNPVPPTGADLAAALTPAFPDKAADLATLGNLLDTQPQDPGMLTKFQTLAQGLVTTPAQGSEDTGEAALVANTDAATVLGHAAAMAPAPVTSALGLGNPFAGLWSGARELLRTLSYYEMKNRAGVVGQNGLGPLLGQLVGPGGPPRIHLMGHSFGARLVAYSLAGLPSSSIGPASPVKTLMLIQGAFSHFAFAHPLPIDPGRAGALAGFADRLDGPLLATFSSFDRATGWWYPAASMLSRQDSEGASDLTYRWGAMGHDGYQQASPGAAVLPLSPPNSHYDFKAGGFYSLNSDAVISAIQSPLSGAHSDIQHPEVTWAVVEAANLCPTRSP